MFWLCPLLEQDDLLVFLYNLIIMKRLFVVSVITAVQKIGISFISISSWLQSAC